jgi:DNA-binding response OmpR family regulator
MLPSRAYANNIPPFSPGGPPQREVALAPTLLVATGQEAIERFSVSSFTRVAATTTADALHVLERTHPRVIAIDWDHADVDGAALCRRARQMNSASILVVTETPEAVPAALRAGCHAVLLKPFAPNLLAARVGRLSREMSAMTAPPGTNRVWADTHCPACDAGNAVSFEFFSYRRMWYACLACDHVWLGPRQE